MKQIALLLFCILMPLLSLRAEVRVTDVSVKPRWPWNGKVDITYSIECDETDDEGNPKAVYVDFMGYDRDRDRTIGMKSLSGDGVAEAVHAGGPYTVTWDAALDDSAFNSAAFQIKIYAMTESPLYMVVDLSGGPEAENYPVHYTNEPPNLDDDTCRATELWLRKIEPGTFTMGSPTNELGRYSDETQHEVTLTQMYYIGVFECTQKQWDLVMGEGKPLYNHYRGDTRPRELITYNEIRGSGWPANGHVATSGTFMGILQKKTGLTFDLPTEAEWEYACRAGTATALNSGKNLTDYRICPNMAEVGRYHYNCNDGKGGYSEHTKVGSYLPNAWGLYDMHGNVYEWCLDWYNSSYGTAAVTDPKGPASGSYRVKRGGYWEHYKPYAEYCRSASRDYDPPTTIGGDGFRVACRADISSTDTVLSDFVRIDARSTAGWQLSEGTAYISPVAESANDNARLSVDGKAANGWSVAAPSFDTTRLADGWHAFALNEGAATAEANLLVLNDMAVVQHGGVLETDEMWGADKVHVVCHWVRIPEGMTLTIEEGAVVKFCEGTGLQNGGTLVATGATFTSIADDTVGGDTDMNGDGGTLVYGLYSFTGSGIRTMAECDVRYSANLPVTLHGGRAA